MSKTLADYSNNSVTNLNDFYPSNLKNEFIDGINETIFNRFLTKQDYKQVIGAIGDEDLSSTIRNILEEGAFAQNNQLQPVITTQIGAQSAFLSWQDFMRRLSQQDVDIDAYDTWGAVTQFNWVPPIDLDKFINYRDYYWDSDRYNQNTPDYVTIRNRTVTRELTVQQLTKTVADVFLDGTVSTRYNYSNTSVSVDGNVTSAFPVGMDVIIKYTTGAYSTTRVESSVYDTVNTETVVTVGALLELPVYSIVSMWVNCYRDALTPTVINIPGGNYTGLFTVGYIFSTFQSGADDVTAVTTTQSVFDLALNKTVVTLSHPVETSTNMLSVAPVVLSAQFEATFEDGYAYSSTYSPDTVYETIWALKLNKVTSASGITYLSTNKLTDYSVDFILSGVAIGDTLDIITPSLTTVTCEVTNVTQHEIQFTTTEPSYIFSITNVSYSIFSFKPTEDYYTIPQTPSSGDIWIDTTTDVLKFYETSIWVNKVYNFSVLFENVKDLKTLVDDNAWTLSNAWTHKTQIGTTANKIRAQLPIIEFSDSLVLSDMTKVTHDWSYRASNQYSYVQASSEPPVIELVNIEKVSADSPFAFDDADANIIYFASTYGNLTDALTAGTKLTLAGFEFNDGQYEVASSEYAQISPTSNKLTTVYLTSGIPVATDQPIGAKIHPTYTKSGDLYISWDTHWRYDGVNQINSTSQRPIKNDIYSHIAGISSNGIEESKYGFNWQSYVLVAGSETDYTYQFNTNLHKYCLADDYQEGDLRVYINKIRQYGNFIEIPSIYDGRYVGGIQFVGGVTITTSDVVLIEVGEYANIDAGRKAVTVSTPSGYELTNLSRYKKHEQNKIETSQYPEFIVLDSMTAEEFETSSKIFSYVEDSTQPMNPFILKKLAYKDTSFGKTYIFEQHLKHDEETLSYELKTPSGSIARNIWRVGSNLEKYKPTKNIEGDWNIPNNWYYNMYHENRGVNTYLDLYTHFRSIIQKQVQPGLPSNTANSYYADSAINFGLGGTIKEHNTNIDILASAVFNTNITVENLITSAKQRYSESLYKIENILLDNVGELFSLEATDAADLTAKINEYVLDIYENDSVLSYWFGDSSSYSNGVGVRNWPLTLPMMSIVKPVQPRQLIDPDIFLYQIVHHDGHRSNTNLSPALREQLYTNILAGKEYASDNVASDAQPFPLFIGDRQVVVGDYLLRTNYTAFTRTLYRYNGLTWEPLSLTKVLMDCITNVEQKLYEISQTLFDGIVYDLNKVQTNQLYDEKLKKQFDKFAASSNVSSPLSNKDKYSSNLPYTWNYYHSTPSTNPTVNSYVPSSNWRQLYTENFGTAYPHIEPWVLQGYVEEPSWWNAEYVNVTTGKYIIGMWDNIFNGVIPAGNMLPSGTVSNGTTQTTVYTYLPVITQDITTADGYSYGDILPPYWNAANAQSIARIRSLFDPNIGDEIVSPNLDFAFGETGDFEYSWLISLDYLYDRMVISFKLDPMHFMSDTFGYTKYTSACIQMHEHSRNIQAANNTIFHGEQYNGEQFNAPGLNQWYVTNNRYEGYDSQNSEFHAIWKAADVQLSYLFDSMVDSKALQVRSTSFDLTDKDYKVAVKNTKDYDIKKLDSLNLTLLSAPSKYLGDTDRGWTVEISTIPTNKAPINFLSTQNYECAVAGNTFVINSDGLVGVDYEASNEYVRIAYNNTLALTSRIELLDGIIYTAEIAVDGTPYPIEINGSDVDTLSEILDSINAQIENCYVDLELGDLIAHATITSSSLTVTDVNLFASITPEFIQIGTQVTADAIFENGLLIKGNKTTKYKPEMVLVVSNSTTFNGTYTVSSCSYDVSDDITRIEVLENVVIPNGTFVVDGVLTVPVMLPLHPEWTSGTEVYFNSYDSVSGISLERPYYIIRLTDSSFSIAETYELAINNRAAPLTDVIIYGALFVGRLQRTFKALGGATTAINWRVHAIDERQVLDVYDGVSLTGMQRVVDFLTGISGYYYSEGFVISNSYTDATTGRPYSWELFTEKFIDWAFTQRGLRQESKMEYLVSASPSDDSFEFLNSSLPSWGNATSILLIEDAGASVPVGFTASKAVQIPYYIVRTSSLNSVKLAATSYDANRGKYIKFETASSGGIYFQVYEKYENYPTFSYTPFMEEFTITHSVGLTSDIFANGNYVYGSDGNLLNTSQLFISRRDKQTSISLLGKVKDSNLTSKSPVIIAGANIGIQTYEHVMSFNDYTLAGDLIYDAFLGLRTPRFLTEFVRQTEKTLRPTLGGYALRGGDLVQNIESAIDDSRYYYDDIRAQESKQTTDIVRKTLGYDGPKDYMTDIGIGDKSQFLFWKSMIQNKGTNFAVLAYTQQPGLSTAEVDEFWAYKLAEFGGNEQLEYPEMKLLSEDIQKNELRIEFIPPNNTVIDDTFSPVSITDVSRWWDQPDQLDAISPYDTFFFSGKVNAITYSAENKIQEMRGEKVIILSQYTDYAIITHNDNGVIRTLVENEDFNFVNSLMIKFTNNVNPSTLTDITIASLTYDLDTQNPSKLIDKKNRTVVYDIPFWNPALGQYDLNYIAPVDIINATDPAVYNTKLNTNETTKPNLWMSEKVGVIWMDNKQEGFLPYYDRTVMYDLNDRIFNWGKQAEWATIEVYEWTKSNLTPIQWDSEALAHSNDFTIPDDQRVSGNVKKILYENTTPTESTPTWIPIEDIHANTFVGYMTAENAPELYGDIEIYRNGTYMYTSNLQSPDDYMFIEQNLTLGTYLHFIKRAPVPTADQLIALEYTYSTPFVTQRGINPVSGLIENTYYYWVANKYNKIFMGDREYTLVGIKNGIINAQSPYMIVQGIRPPGAGYGMVYGNIFDEFKYELPYRYTQMIVKGLGGSVRDDERYTLRFTKDYNLRDNLGTSLHKKNVHEEWKVFREKQLSKVDRYLWNKLIEALIGYQMTSDDTYNASVRLPALNRVTYDIVFGTDTRYGLGNGQLFSDTQMSKDTITDVISDDLIDAVDDNSKAVLAEVDFSSPESTIESMNNIYETLDAASVNKLFFAVLHDAFSIKGEYSDIFKTSWVALQITQLVEPTVTSPFDKIHNLIPSETC